MLRRLLLALSATALLLAAVPGVAHAGTDPIPCVTIAGWSNC